MIEEVEVQLSPVWRHALQALVKRGLPYGSRIEKSELCELFGLKRPISAQDMERHSLRYMGLFGKLRDELLSTHRLALKTLWGDSAYEVVKPSAQTDLAVSEGLREMKRSVRKMARTLAFVRHEELTDQQRKHNADAQAKASMLAGMIRSPIKIASKDQ